MIDYELAITLAIVAVTFTRPLMEPGRPFRWYWLWLDRLERSGLSIFSHALGYCTVCFSGQLALWTYVITYARDFDHWNPFLMIGFISVTIFTAWVLDKYISHD